MMTTTQNSDEFWNCIYQQTEESIALAKNQQWHALPELLKQRQQLLNNYFSQDVPEHEKNNIIKHLQVIMDMNKQLEKLGKQQNHITLTNIQKLLHNKKSLQAYNYIAQKNNKS